MSIDKKELGRKGEKLALKFFKKKKCKILSSNYSRSTGEIDLIVLDGETVVFVEVKTVSAGSTISPEEQITVHQKKRAIKTALSFVKSKKIYNRPLRMDFLGIRIDKKGASFNLVENYFSVSDMRPDITI